MATRTWVGGGNNDAYDPTKWMPNGLAAGDTLIIDTGTINIAGGNLDGNTLTFSTSPTINLSGGVDLTIGPKAGTTGDAANITVQDADTLHVKNQSLMDGVSLTIAIAQAGKLTGDFALAGGALAISGGSTEFDGAERFNGTKVNLTSTLAGGGTVAIGNAQTITSVVDINAGVTGVTFALDGRTGTTPYLLGAGLKIEQPATFQGSVTLSGMYVGLMGVQADSYTFNGSELDLFAGTTQVDTLKLSLSNAPAEALKVEQNAQGVFLTADPTGGTVHLDQGQPGGAGAVLPLHMAPPQPASPPPGVMPLGPPNNFAVADITSNGSWQSQGMPYDGPVAGIGREIIIATADNINVNSEMPNTFIHTGSGDDAIDVSNVGGTNVLDGGTGSNFLRGGSGPDTFFLDDRNAIANVFSTVVGFTAGDDATIWTPPSFNVTSLTPQDFQVPQRTTAQGIKIVTSNNQGAPGFTGLTIGITSPTSHDANLTLSGYTTNDLTNGRLSMSFGHTDDLPGTPGSDFIRIHANF